MSADSREDRDVSENLEEIRDTSWDPRVGLGRVRGPSGSFGMDRGTFGEVREGSGDYREVHKGQGTLREVGDGSRDLRVCPRRVGRPSGRSGMGWFTLGEVRDGLVYPRGGAGWVGGPSRRFGTDRRRSKRVGGPQGGP